jgi:hypothetical protein
LPWARDPAQPRSTGGKVRLLGRRPPTRLPQRAAPSWFNVRRDGSDNLNPNRGLLRPIRCTGRRGGRHAGPRGLGDRHGWPNGTRLARDRHGIDRPAVGRAFLEGLTILGDIPLLRRLPMNFPKPVVPAVPRVRRRWWTGVGLVATGGALVLVGAVALSSQAYQAGSTAQGGGLGGSGSVQLTFSFTGPPALFLALWAALGLVPLLAIVSPRASWPALGASLALAFSVGTYALATSLPGPSLAAILAWSGLMLSGACLNCVGSWLLHGTKVRPGARPATLVRLAKRASAPADERTPPPAREGSTDGRWGTGRPVGTRATGEAQVRPSSLDRVVRDLLPGHPPRLLPKDRAER